MSLSIVSHVPGIVVNSTKCQMLKAHVLRNVRARARESGRKRH